MSNKRKALELLGNVRGDFRVSGIGSVPFIDTNEACEIIMQHCPFIPYTPQLIKRSLRENMFLQFVDNLPCLKADIERERIYFNVAADRTANLCVFYEHLMSNDYEHFRIGPFGEAVGFHSMLQKCIDRENPFIKTQVTGPVTYILSITNNENEYLIHDEELCEAIAFGLAMKGLWQIKEIKKIGKHPVLFFDEPSLWDLNSKYIPISTEKVKRLIGQAVELVKEKDSDVLVGLHCCGNTDWAMVLGLDIDVLSLDSYFFGQNLVLYPEETNNFLKKGGFIAFGVVPTAAYRRDITEDNFYKRFIGIMEGFEEKGVKKNLLLDHTIFTPACGMGPLRPAEALRVMELVGSVSRQIHKSYQEGRIGVKQEFTW